jgi:hypothetical protein
MGRMPATTWKLSTGGLTILTKRRWMYWNYLGTLSAEKINALNQALRVALEILD